VAWNIQQAEQGTTTSTSTVTPVGFPLSRYSHRAPREGRSLLMLAVGMLGWRKKKKRGREMSREEE
jgi:hypothetical protein